MKEIISIMNGFNWSASDNANAVCLYKIIKADKNIHYTVITDVPTEKWVSLPENVSLIYEDFSAWRTRWKTLKILEKLTVSGANIASGISNPNFLLISFPALNLMLIPRLKKKIPQANIILYELDPYAHNKGFRTQKLLFSLRKKREELAFRLAEKIFLTYELAEFYRKNSFRKFSNKFIAVGQPAIDEDHYIEERKLKTDDTVVISYFGLINDSFRNPLEYLPDFCEQMNRINLDYEIRFYGSDEKYLQDLSKKMRSKVKVLPFVPQSAYKETVSKADFLLNISNKALGNVMPSKILEYIGTGKPIINFADGPDNVTVHLLEKYRLGFSFFPKKNEFGLLENFITEARNKSVSKHEITSSFSDFSAKEISEKIDSFFV